MHFEKPSVVDHPLYQPVISAYRCDETAHVRKLLDAADLPAESKERIAERARGLVQEVRRNSRDSGIDAFMHEYELSSQEGVVLMCLAEAMLRVPDAETVDKLIEDKIGGSNWESHLGASTSWFVNASTWGLMLTGRVLKSQDNPERNFRTIMHRMVRRSGEPVIRQAVRQAMRIMGRQFVMGRTINEALKRARPLEKEGYRYSYDMLGEAARTEADALRYFEDYRQAIEAIGAVAGDRGPYDSPGVSVKLSALHARYELSHRRRVMEELVPRLRDLCRLAAHHDINLTIDAEEAARLDLSMEIIEMVSSDPELGDWQGLGLAVQAYQKRAFPLLDWLADLARRHGRRFMVRLVKGAYWDTEIKIAQEQGLDGYPVFTRKANTDVAYLACARKMLADREAFYPQFATHNAHTLAYVLEVAGDNRDFEFQRLHGMGEALYDQIVGEDNLDLPCRIYAPVGSHEDLLAYLVRRLLENGANSSFVNRIVDEKTPVDEIIADPIAQVRRHHTIPHPRIPLPADIYGPERRNSMGVDISDITHLNWLHEGMQRADAMDWQGGPIIGGSTRLGEGEAVRAPADRTRVVGQITWATPQDVEDAIARAQRAFDDWDRTPASERAACIERYADLLEAEMPTLIALCAREAGKHIPDGIAEVREAVDFCRYYAAQARREFDGPMPLPGPTGERNTIELRGRGVFVCISPWNFPLAIFTGQVTAALAAGNAVIAKPAEQTSLIGHYAVSLLHRAGIPGDVLQLLPGDGPTVGAPLVADPRISGVAFTGSVPTARGINQTLAQRDGPILPLIAETGGQNAMIVDSSALPEQVVADVLKSSFQSAGQRCSALRVLYVQEDIADKLLVMLRGAMAELSIGDPWSLATDVTPVIDEDARRMLSEHAERMEKEATLLHRCELPVNGGSGTFFPAQAYQLESIEQLGEEKFGPILHVVRFRARDIDRVVDEVNAMGYGLTFGIHSRIDTTVNRVVSRMKVGNAYVNRNMIGAVVGVHPFGGEGLSGTGPKAGGPRYLYRFATERALSIDTTAAGGNASLMSLEDEGTGESGENLLLPEPQRFNE
ncbi:bifunctional proline dehydrogenase/L-glutamate gamma-semialdehyde dehydrogenase PutA [Arhodomonas aquaeolei]|uniref:bifunctional proline dehydrogenase/L-glutamate gamma-semialdehyde dehydrogenase PutA n=1 Tax=Arhodomonas aquaeolei TaxID=2369 RepID=UPI00037FF5A2|nr:bifunctional proline dehydrogenase/L-glutamate gamma-semialdehyde dehydrogenase PutA [Arhodomonas aquaeolei]